MNNSTLTKPESDFLRHMMMFGSAGYPIRKVRSRWIWDEFWGIQGAPTTYKTKREGFAAIERYISVLCDKAAGR